MVRLVFWQPPLEVFFMFRLQAVSCGYKNDSLVGMAEKALILFGILIVGFIGSSDLEEIIDRPRKEDEAENTIEQLVCLHLGIICQ